MNLKGKKADPYKIAEEICKYHKLLFDKRLINLGANKRFNTNIGNNIKLIVVPNAKRKDDTFYYYNYKTYDAKVIPIKTFRPIWNEAFIELIKKHDNIKLLINKI